MKHLEKPTNGEERIASHIADAAYKVHRTLGPGLLENVYEKCFYRWLNMGLKELSYKI